MANNKGNIEIIVNTLLQVGERVIEVSQDLVITNVWYSTANKPNNISNKQIVDRSFKQISEVFATGKKGHAAYIPAGNGDVVSYSVRILPVHPDKQFLFLVVEEQMKTADNPTIENSWRMALDATGDGMWELDMENDKVQFSEKWHKTFGYTADEISSGKDWAAKLHPEDVRKSKETIDKYLSGELPMYSAELRYRGKDGKYHWILSRGITISRNEKGMPIRSIGTHTDINDRKLAEDKFSSLAQLLSKLINNLHDGILVTDEHQNIIFANQMYCDIYDIDKSPEQLVGMHLDTSIKSRTSIYEEPERYRQKTEAILEKKVIVLDEEWRLKDGRTLNRDFIPLILGNNNKGGIWKFRDITAQKNTEKRLSDLRNFYEQILNHIAADIVVFDAQQRYIFVNPTAVKNPELREWLIGKTDEDYCKLRNKPQSVIDRRKSIFDTSRDERRTVEWEERLETPTGEIEHHLRNNYPVFDEHGHHVMSIYYGLNITDRKHAEDALKTSKDTFASAFNYSGIGMALVNMDGQWLDVNNALCEMTGYTKDELMKLSIRQITYHGDLDSDTDLLKKLLRRDISKYTIERRYVSKKNKIVVVLLTVSLVWSNDGIPKFLIAQVVDITLKKALEQEIHKKTAELETTKVSLVNKISQLEALSHIIAHNLRGPAGNIKMLSEALLDKLKGGQASADNMLSDAFSTEEVIALIQESSVSLIDSLSTQMKLTEIRLNEDIPYDECNVPLIIKDITSQLHSMIFEKRATLKLNLDIEEIKYPKAYLENILYNLISNALKYSQPDVPPEITVATKRHKGRIQITVKDNGLGIDMEKYGDKVFKLNEVFHKGYDSKGVGLYITKTQIESLGGSITLNSQLNEGCEFIVTL